MSEATNRTYEGRVVTIKDLWAILAQRWWLLALIGAASMVLTFAVNKIAVAPQYESTATLYILRQEEQEASSSDFSLALNVVNDCNYLLKSHSVLDEVIESLELEIPFTTLYNSVRTANPTDTRILEVTVTADSPEEAKRIVDEVCRIGTEKITEAMGFQQVNLYEYGKLNEVPANGMGLSGYILVVLITVVLAYAVFLFIFILDDRIHNAQDIESRLGLSILGEIPDCEAPKKRGHYGYYRTDPDKHSGK